MSIESYGELKLGKDTYIVVSTNDYINSDVEIFRIAMGLPPLVDVSIGYLIRQHRIKLGLGQKEFGRRIGSGQKHVDKVENGKIKTPKDKFIRNSIKELGDDFLKGMILIGAKIPEEIDAK